ncbi:MAG: hypothetical protein B5766_08310 [Candidatus Lumbricidophila eiseniae]|uniref:HicB family toxin-antitoxin system n=1 Tax=Candidatus Lumbricidiphila eiseniae TaxID=1969409 RepID=A0A2A6FRE3_9MICO|nr:MAG: hypothetical protein B5766_08310 [Candidatus Lumbricidophila eiseniae]
MTITYTVTAERSGRFWAIDIPEIQGGHTQARSLTEVDVMARDCICILKDIPADSFDIDVSVKLPTTAQEHLTAARSLSAQAVAVQAKAAAESRAAARELKAAGLTLREIGIVLGVSHQRAHQLVH